MALSSKAVTIFATLEALRDSQPDIRYPLATLFEPDLAKFNGSVFDPNALALEINKQYHLSITSDILEDFALIFERRGWLQKVVDTQKGIGFVVQCPPTSQVPKELDEFQKTGARLASEFRAFIGKLSPLSQVNKSDSELVDGLVDWLILLDRAGENSLKKAVTHYQVGKKLVMSVPDNEDGGSPSEETFLSARFVEHLFESDSDLIPFLIELSEVGLVTEVVRDFQRPSNAVEETSLALYLDAPLAMDYLGLSGKPQRASVALIFDGVKKAGGSIRIYRESILEIQHTLNALLARAVPERTGPTADAIRRREVFEPFVREVAARPDKFLTAQGVMPVEDDLDTFPNQHKFFTRDAYEYLYSQIGWVKEDGARHHDALIATLAARRRAGYRTSDIFDSKHVVVTRNPEFPMLAKRVAREYHFIGPAHVGPVIHARQLATAVWLRMGVQDKSEIPRSYILSACRRVLTLRKNIVEKVHEYKSLLSAEQMEQLEILMTSDKSTQVLMDKTLGSSAIIDAKNMPTLLEEMKKAQIEEYAQERDAEQEAIEREAKLREIDLAASAELEKNRAEKAEAEVIAEREKVFGVYDRVIQRANTKIRRERFLVIFATTMVFAVSALVGFSSQGVEPFWAAIAFGLVLGMGVALHVFSSLSSYVVDPWFKKRDRAKLGQTALEFGLSYDEIYEAADYADHQYFLKGGD